MSAVAASFSAVVGGESSLVPGSPIAGPSEPIAGSSTTGACLQGSRDQEESPLQDLWRDRVETSEGGLRLEDPTVEKRERIRGCKELIAAAVKAVDDVPPGSRAVAQKLI